MVFGFFFFAGPEFYPFIIIIYFLSGPTAFLCEGAKRRGGGYSAISRLSKGFLSTGTYFVSESIDELTCCAAFWIGTVPEVSAGTLSYGVRRWREGPAGVHVRVPTGENFCSWPFAPKDADLPARSPPAS